MSLEDCGVVIHLNFDVAHSRSATRFSKDVQPVMVIVHPRGELRLYGDNALAQQQAIERFMRYCNDNQT
jgi:hypothetical protein